MSLINRRVSLLVTVVFLNTSVFAQTSGANYRPANRAEAPAQNALPGGINAAAAAAAKARATTAFENVAALKTVSTDARAVILDKMGSNKMIGLLYDGVGQQVVISGNDPLINESIALRMEIGAAISDMDIENPAVASTLGRDVNVQAQYILGYLISRINITSMSVDSRNTILVLYRAIKEQLEIQGATNAQSVLINALETLGTVKGLALKLEEIFYAVAEEKEKPKSGALQGLFMSANDVQKMLVGSIKGAELIVQMSPAEIEKISQRAKKEFWDMVHLGEGNRAFTTAQVNSGVSQIMSTSNVNIADKFIEDNHLLLQTEVADNHREKVVNEVGETYGSLIATLNELGAVIDGNSFYGKVGRALEGKPIIGRIGTWAKNQNDVSTKKMTLKNKIQSVQKTLQDGLTQIEKDNHKLNDLRARAREHQLQLEKQSVRLKFMADDYAKYIEVLNASDPEKAKTLNINVGQPLQREMNYVLTILFTLKNAIAGFDTTIMLGMTTIQDSEVLIRGLIPAMALTESQQSAMANQDAHLKRQEAATKLIEKRMLILSQMQIKSAEKAVLMAENSILNPKVLEEVRANNQKAIEIFRNGKSRAQEKLRIVNQQLIDSNNKTESGSQDAGTTDAVNRILRNGKN